MKNVKMFVLKNCPHCQRALKMIDEIKETNPLYKLVELNIIDEAKRVDIAEKHDYYYVPAFYVDDIKIHEGVPTKEAIEEVFSAAIN